MIPGVRILSGPMSWQILPRQAGAGTLELAGDSAVEAVRMRVEARLVRELDGAAVVDWRGAELGSDGTWSLSMDAVPAGGLFRLETRAWRGSGPDIRPARGDFRHHLGVGDLWIIAGQSNASGTGLGVAEDPPTLGVHLFANDERWRLATHPLEDATDTLHPITVHGVFQGHAPWLAFGRRLQAALGYPIGLIPTALGGSPLSRWDPAREDDLFANLLSMVRGAGGVVHGMIWYQGESDANAGLTDDYATDFARFVTAVREAVGVPDLPVLTAQLCRYTAPVPPAMHENWTRLRQAQREAAARLSRVWLIPTLDLPLSDEIHISTAGNVQLGQRFADGALRWVYGRDLPPAAVELVELRWSSLEPPVLRVVFERSPSGWCRPGRCGDFRVKDAAGEIEVRQVTLDDDGWLDLELARAPEGDGILDCRPGCDPPADLRDRDQRPVLAFREPLPPR